MIPNLFPSSFVDYSMRLILFWASIKGIIPAAIICTSYPFHLYMFCELKLWISFAGKAIARFISLTFTLNCSRRLDMRSILCKFLSFVPIMVLRNALSLRPFIDLQGSLFYGFCKIFMLYDVYMICTHVFLSDCALQLWDFISTWNLLLLPHVSGMALVLPLEKQHLAEINTEYYRSNGQPIQEYR
jgi:hypothetical protein